MSATQPASTTELKEYALRKLGKPVVEVNLADEQMDDLIDEAIQYFQEYHFDGTERAFHVELVTPSTLTFAGASTGTFTDGEKEFFVLTISNPCGKDDFPMEVNKNYFCNGKKLDDKQVYVLDDRLVIGLFHNASKCNEQSIAAIDKHEITGQYCAFRNNAPLEEVKGGMGDIFIRLAKDN